MGGVFIVGTDTDVGKTTVCGGLLKLLQGSRKLHYWKPVQTGTIMGDDTATLKESVDVSADHFLEPAYRFPEPVSPHMAARKWGKTIELETILSAWQAVQSKGNPFVVVEGAGGVLVPYSENLLQIDVMKALKIPALIVSEDRVGAINLTLLTVRALAALQIPVLGVVMTKSRGSWGNSEAIEHFGKVKILAEFPPTQDIKSLIAQVGAHAGLRDVFKVTQLP